MYSIKYHCSPNGKCPCERKDKDCPIKDVIDKYHHFGEWVFKCKNIGPGAIYAKASPEQLENLSLDS